MFCDAKFTDSYNKQVCKKIIWNMPYSLPSKEIIIINQNKKSASYKASHVSWNVR